MMMMMMMMMMTMVMILALQQLHALPKRQVDTVGSPFSLLGRYIVIQVNQAPK